MKAKGLLTLLVSLGIAGVAALMANNWISQRLGAVERPDDLVQVVSAAVDIPVGTQIEATHVKMIPISAEAVSEGSITKFEGVVGRVATQRLYAGEMVVERRLADNAAGSALAVVIEPGKRALTVRVNDVIGVAGFLLPGSRVDVISIQQRGKSSISETLLQNLKVLAVDQTASADKNDPVIVRAVTLEVTPKEAETVVKATTLGSVQLTLRNPLDVEKIAPPVVPEPPPVLAAAPAPKPQRRPTGYRVDVIRGTAVSRTSVAN